MEDSDIACDVALVSRRDRGPVVEAVRGGRERDDEEEYSGTTGPLHRSCEAISRRAPPAGRRTATSRTVSSLATEEPSPLESSWPPRWRSPLGKVAHMEAEFTIEPTGRRVVLAKLRSVLRGDKCMADASLLDAPGRAVPDASRTRAGLGHA